MAAPRPNDVHPAVPSLPSRFCALLLPLLVLTTGGCGSHENDYKLKAAPSGKPATLPAVPPLSQRPRKQGDAYTVYGASHDLRSRVQSAKIRDKKITLFGYITKTNLADAPKCAVHRTGKKDGPECEKNPPSVPMFWVADEKGAAESASIKVMGFASNYAKIYDAMQKYKSAGAKEIKDDTWSVDIPNPLPAKDAKVKVVGTYSTAFTKASQGSETDPIMGILTYESITYLEPAPAPATMPGM